MANYYTEAQKRATNKYLSEKVEEVKLRVPKGMKERIRSHAAIFDGGSVNAFLQRAIAETIERDEHTKA